MDGGITEILKLKFLDIDGSTKESFKNMTSDTINKIIP